MTRQTPSSTPPRQTRRLGLVALVAGSLALGFGIGRWSAADAPQHASAPAPSRPTFQYAPPPVAAAPTPIASPAPQPAVVAEPVAPAASAARPAPPQTAAGRAELVARVTEHAKAELQDQHGFMTSRCWPENGLRDNTKSARVTFNIAFDANGREIARGISNDRRVRAAAELTRCLRTLSGMALSIAPPGANVSVTVPMTFP